MHANATFVSPYFSLALERHLLIVCPIINFMTPSKKNSPACLALLFLQLAFTAALPAQEVRVVETNLSNGMRLLMVGRHDEPSIAGGWVAHVGSANEHPGMTGIAHLFEHMMFKGTTTIGTTDAPKDFEILAAQEKIRNEMRAEEAKLRGEMRSGKIDDLLKPENWTPHY